jgi:hypothetical protein
VINEFYFNNAGADTLEYIEVFAERASPDAPAGNLYVLQVEGDVAANATQRGRIDSVHAVSAPAAGGHVLINLPANTLENGAFTLLLVSAASAPGVATADDGANDIDANNDGVIDAGIAFTILDAVGIADSAEDSTYADAVRLTNTTSSVGGFSRIPDRTDTNSSADWLPNDQALDPNDDLDPTPDAGEARNTPGVANLLEAAASTAGVSVTGATPALTEGGAGATVSFVLTSQPTADVTITLAPDADVTADAASLTFTSANWNVAQSVTVTAVDDTIAEGTHPGTVVTTAASTDAAYDGIAVTDIVASITDNDATAPVLTEISAIQGAGHRSTLEGQVVTTTGIVTARSSNGFWMQDPTPDAEIGTSEGIFVFTSSAPAVTVGDAVQVQGTVTEFTRTTSSPGHLSITELTFATVTVQSSGNALPAATVIDLDRTPPTENTDDDGFTVYDPVLDGVDFWESLEGMRVTLPDALAVSPSFNSSSASNRAETFAVANRGTGATGLNSDGGLTLTETDDNPERVAVQANQTVLPGADFVTLPGDLLGDVTGVLDYDSRGNFEIILTQAITVTSDGLAKEELAIATGDATHLTVGTYNVENLAGNGPQAKFDALGVDIVDVMGAPDIIALQEIQDNNGTTDNGMVAADLTYQKLIDAIVLAGGPRYEVLNIDPANNTSGGAPGGNIRVGYLYNPDRVDFVAGTLRQVDPGNTAAWAQSRIPLAADFEFNGEVVTIVNNHWASKGGSSPQFGSIQPLLNGSEDQRVLQAAAVNGFVDAALAIDPGAKIMVMGDLNEFPWEDSLQIVTGTAGGGQPVLFDLYELTEPNPVERYEYVFDGNHQILDHMLASDALVQGGFAFQSIQINSQYPASQRNSDHDPAVASFRFAGEIQLEFWGANVFPGASPARAPDVHWRDQAADLHYTAANTPGVQRAASTTDSATGASDDVFSSLDGDVVISQLDFASGPRGTAGGAALVTLDWLSDNAALVRSDAAWGSLKGLRIDSFSGDALRLEGFVDLHLALTEATRDLAVVADGLRRGTIETGSGDDRITVGFDSVDTTWGNTVVVRAGSGNDVITIGAASRNYISGAWNLAGSSSIVTGGAGDDTLVGAASRDTAVFTGRAADYTIAVNAGVTTVIGADGADTIQNFEFLRFADTTLAFQGGIWA